MKNLLSLAKRNFKETIREPLSLVFCLIFPVLMLLLLTLIFQNFEIVPENFKITNYANGICVFGYSFAGLFVALQISADKNSSFIKRINIAPTSKMLYYFSLVVSALWITISQTIIFYSIALIFGYPFNLNLLIGFFYLIPSQVFYISVGVFIGSVCKNEKQTGPITSIVTTLVGLLGGVFMPISAFKGGFATFVNILPFSHTVSIASELLTKGAVCIYPHILYIVGYTIVIWALIMIFKKE